MLPENVFDAEALIRICQMREGSFAKAYGMTTVEVDQPAPANYYHFKDNGSDILAVAHLDTVAGRKARTARIVDTEAGKPKVIDQWTISEKIPLDYLVSK